MATEYGEGAAGSFSIDGFYNWRARRILPALFLVMGVTPPFAWMWMLPTQLRAFYFDDDRLNNVGAGFIVDAILVAMQRWK